MLRIKDGKSYPAPLWQKAQQIVADKPDFKPTGNNAKYIATSHVETKYAAWMADKGITNTNMVINNSEGACNRAQNCATTVGYILPAGAALTVYYPGGKKVLQGNRTTPWP
ncbi:DddA-like double-stranded DNA deaminase toxin [Streptomyces sp. NPDC002262]|uniref:DddA-like double-stranded DNA deaminase toxin n=1 Tax=Streptomyces sp. NPDC002262 TaxID=3154414 RepID=UPI003333CF0A